MKYYYNAGVKQPDYALCIPGNRRQFKAKKQCGKKQIVKPNPLPFFAPSPFRQKANTCSGLPAQRKSRKKESRHNGRDTFS
jgi:hypothetical protein